MSVPQYDQQAAKLIAEQFKGKPNFLAFVNMDAKRIQEMEEVGQRLLYLRFLELADGAQLDELGNSLNEGRGQRTDAAYRAALRSAILRNACDGTPDGMIRYVKSLTGATNVQYTPDYPRSFTLEHNGTVVLSLPRLIRDVAPPGTGDITIIQGTITQVDEA